MPNILKTLRSETGRLTTKLVALVYRLKKTDNFN